MTNTLTVRWISSLVELDEASWDHLCIDIGLYACHRWLRTMESDQGVSTEYLLVEDNGTLRAGLPVHHVTEETSSFYRPERYQAVVGDGPWLLVGTRRAYRSGILVDPDLSTSETDDVVDAALTAALRRAAELGHRGVVWLYATTAHARMLYRHGASAVIDDAEAEVPVPSGDLDAFFRTCSRSDRHQMRREWRRFSEAGYDVRRAKLSSCWWSLVPLSANLQGKYGHRPPPENLSRRLRTQAEGLDDLSTVFGAHGGGSLRGFTLNYRWSRTLYARMAGFDYDALVGAYEYFALAYYEPIRYMTEMGLTRLHLGIGSLEAKVRRGAVLHPLWMVSLDHSRRSLTGPGSGYEVREAWRSTLPSRAIQPEEWCLNQDAH